MSRINAPIENSLIAPFKRCMPYGSVVAAKMFDTMGLEVALAKSFENHYRRFVKNNNTRYRKRQAMEIFDKEGQLYIGSSNIGSFMQKIVDVYGEPPSALPRQIDLFIRKKNPNETAAAMFRVNGLRFEILKVAQDPFAIEVNVDQIAYSISHETQHFLKAIYSGSKAPSYAYKPDYQKIEDYYSDPWEIQAVCVVIAQKAMELISLMVEEAAKFKDVGKIVVNLWEDRDKLVSRYAVNETKAFLDAIEKREGKAFPSKIRNLYYKTTYRNLSDLFEKFLLAKRDEILQSVPS